MTGSTFTLFDTAIGVCGIAWTERGISGIQLPEGDRPRTALRMRRRFPEAVPAAPAPAIERAIAAIVALLAGRSTDLASIQLDMDRVPPFDRRVYEVTRAIPVGRTMTYGDVAARLGARGSSRAVGQALGRNPFAIVVPCHRVVAAGGRLGGFSARGGGDTKIRLLGIEGVAVPRTASLFPAPDPEDGSGAAKVTKTVSDHEAHESGSALPKTL